MASTYTTRLQMKGLTLRKANISDLEFYFNLRNMKHIREQSFNDNPILPENHREWFERKLTENSTFLFVIQKDSSNIGQVRIDIIDDSGEIDVAILPDYWGKGYGSWGISKACHKVFKTRTDVHEIKALIKNENRGSISSFKKAGFIITGKIIFKRQNITIMTLMKGTE